MDEERLIHLLRALPQEQARAGFTARVLRRLDDEAEGTASSRLYASRLHRLMLASATVATVAVSVALLPREHTPLPLSVTLAPVGATMKVAAALQPLAAHRLAPQRLGLQQAFSRPAAELDTTQVRQQLQELRQESSRLERELHSMQRPAVRRASAPPAEVYLGSDEGADLPISTGRARAAQVAPAGDRDDGELNNFLD
jgi:hypothetical protein